MPAWCWAQASNPQDDSSLKISRPDQQEQESDSGLSDLLSDKPEVPVTTPSRAAPPQRARLPRENALVVNRLCRLETQKDTNWLVVRFLDEPGKPAEMDRYALPNQRLADMEAIALHDPKATFRISGESLNYKDKPYLIIRLALAQGERVLAPSSQPAGNEPASTQAAAAATDPDEVIRQLLMDKPGKPILSQSDEDAPVDAQPSVSPALAQQLPQAFGTMVVDRVAYLALEQESGWWMIRFAADNTLQERPMRLLPCSQLSQAQRLFSDQLKRVVKLRISGEITRYKGKEYLLIRKVIRLREMGQF